MTKGEKLTKEQVESIVKKYLELEDKNMRSESALLIAEHFGSKLDVAKAKQILNDHLKNRGLSREMSEKRSKLNDKLLPLFDAAIDKYKIKKYATGGGVPVYEETDVEDLRLLLAENYDHEVDGDGHDVAKAFNRNRRGSKAKYDPSTDKITYIVDYEEQMANGGEISVYNLRKGDKVRTRKGDIETIIRKTGSGSYETIENDYSHSPESLEFVSRPGRKMATGGGVDDYTKNFARVEVIFANPKYNYSTSVNGDLTEKEAREYFVGNVFDRGAYPRENMQKVIDIKFYPKGTYARGGGVDGKMTFKEFSETLRDNDKINSYTGKTTTGMEMYYLPTGHPHLGKKFAHKNKRKAYEEYLSSMSKTTMATGGSLETYVVVSKAPDGYLVVMSKPVSSKSEADKLAKMTTTPKGEVIHVMKTEDVRSSKKVLGKEYLAHGGTVGDFYVYGKFDEETTWEPIKSFETKQQAQLFINKAKHSGIKMSSLPYKFDEYKITNRKSKNWEENEVVFMKEGGTIGDAEKGYGIIEYASDMIAYDDYIDADKLEEIMKREGVSHADVMASWKNDWDADEWTGEQIQIIKSLGKTKMSHGGVTGEKVYNEMYGVGSSKYVVNFHDGKKTHKDGSPFFDIQMFKNKVDLKKFIDKLISEGYKAKYAQGGGIESLRDEIKDLLEEIEFVSVDKSLTESFKEKYIAELKDIIQYKKEKIRTFYHSEDKMAFGGMVYDLSDSAIDRMNGLYPNEEMDTFLNTANFIIQDMENEGFEKDEIISFLAHKMVETTKYETGGSVEECEYCVVMSGGSVGEFKGMYDRAGNKLVATFDMKDCEQKAKEYAKRMNAGLSPGEKKYYRLKYIAKKYNPKQFTMVERKATGGNIESGAAHLYITLGDGNIKVYHGDDNKTLLLEKNQVREGSWNKMWECLRGL
jgi:hypothetical protein